MAGSYSQDDTWDTFGTLTTSHQKLSAGDPYFPTESSNERRGPEAIRQLVFAATSSYIPIIQENEISEGTKTLGAGGAAHIHDGTWRGRLVALKKFDVGVPSISRSENPKLLRRIEEAKTELITMSSQFLQSQGNICRLLAIYFSASGSGQDMVLEPVLVMEQANLSLSDCIRDGRFSSLDDRVSIIRGLANGISAFHDAGIVHGDLKPSNCLIFEESPGKPLAKVADFGCSKFFAQNELSESYGGTIYWDAPECLEEAPDSLKPYAMRTSRDIFSFGMIVVETIFERSSLEDVGWPVLASENGSAGTIPAYLRIKRINELKLSGEIASRAGTLFRERFHPANFELFPLDLSKNTTAPEPPPEDIPGTTLLKPAELEAEVRQGMQLKWEEHTIVDGEIVIRPLDLDIPFAFSCMHLILESDPVQRPTSEGLRQLFKDNSKLDPPARLRRGWIPIKVRQSQLEYLEYQGTMFVERCRQGLIPPEITRYIFETIKSEADDTPWPNGLCQLSELYRWGIGVEADPRLSKKYLKLAAEKGARHARKFCLIRSEISDDAISHLNSAEKVEWGLDCLLSGLPSDLSENLHNCLMGLDQDAVAELLSYSVIQTMGTVLKLRQQEAPNVDSIPRSLFEDDHITLEEIVEEIEAKHSSEAVRTVLADWLQYAGIMGKHAVLRFILLHEAFDLECPELSGTLIECVRRNDLQGLLIFMECCIDVEKLLDDNELFNAAYIGSDILANLELILQRRKARGLTSGKEHYPLLVQKDGHERAALGGGQTTLLHCTIIANNWDGFCVLISRGNVDIQDEAGGMTALHLAIILGRPMFAIVLLLMGTNCKEVIENEVGTFGQTTLLHLACRPVRASTAYDMHEVYRVDEDGVHTGPIEGPFRSEPPLKAWQILILVLLENSFDINASDENRITPIRYLIRAEGSLDRIQFLHSLGADLNVPDSNGETALHTCCYNDDIPLDVAKFIVENSSATLLNSGSATSDPTKPSILSLASQKGRLDFCRLLLAKGTRLTLRDKLRFDDDEPWIELTGPDAPQLEEVDQLLEKLSDIPINSEIEELIVCVSKKQGKIHVFLDCVEPHINSSDIVGRTRLHTAVLNGDVEAVELLLSLGAILGRKDWAGLTALHYAYAVGDKAIIEVLENAERGKNEAAISFEGQNGDDEPESPSITPKEVGDIVRGRRDLWDGYCRRSNAEMIRRAGE